MIVLVFVSAPTPEAAGMTSAGDETRGGRQGGREAGGRTMESWEAECEEIARVLSSLSSHAGVKIQITR